MNENLNNYINNYFLNSQQKLKVCKKKIFPLNKK